MAKIIGETLKGEVHVDGNSYAYCNFEGATLIYSGGQAPDFRYCDLTGCKLSFASAALNTLSVLRSFARENSGFRPVVLRELAAMVSTEQLA